MPSFGPGIGTPACCLLPRPAPASAPPAPSTELRKTDPEPGDAQKGCHGNRCASEERQGASLTSVQPSTAPREGGPSCKLSLELPLGTWPRHPNQSKAVSGRDDDQAVPPALSEWCPEGRGWPLLGLLLLSRWGRSLLCYRAGRGGLESWTRPQLKLSVALSVTVLGSQEGMRQMKERSDRLRSRVRIPGCDSDSTCVGCVALSQLLNISGLHFSHPQTRLGAL